MEPTPPPINPVNVLMADIAIITQYVRAYNKRPLPATADEVKGLVKLAERDRPLVVKVTTEAVVEQIMGKTGESVAKFQSLYNQFLLLLEAQAKALKQDLATQATAMQTAARDGERAAVAMKASADAVAAAGKKVKEDLPTSLPVSGEVYGFTNEKSVAWTVGGCLLLGALFYWAAATFFGPTQASKAAYEQLQAQHAALQVKNTKLSKEGNYYLKQIKQYQAKNPETTAFPLYEEAK